MAKMKSRLAVALPLLLAGLALHAEVYKWVDEEGRVHYTDRPPTQEQPALLPKLQVVEPTAFKDPPGSVAACIASKGFKFYGSSWCPQCARQKHNFGSDAARLPYIECSPDGSKRRTSQCVAENISAYPTWVFPDGRRHSGVYSREKLAKLSGCA